MRKRITALLLAFVMTASLLPVTAQAVSPEAEAQAAVITTAAEFAAMAPDGNYRLEADITVDEPYGRTFTGSFDGAHHIITIDLHASAGGPVGAWGLFGELDGAAVKDLRLRGELTAAEDSGVRSLGALAGTVSGDTAIGGCRSEAAVQSEVSGGSVGGFVGRVTGGTLTMTGCAGAGVVKALDSAAAGGLVGSLDGGSMTLTRCYQYGDVLGGVCAGGLVGQIAEQADCTASYGYAALRPAAEDAAAPENWGELRTVSAEKAGALCGEGTFSAESKALFWSGKAFGTDAVPAGGRFEETDAAAVLAALNEGAAEDDTNGFLLTAENGGWPMLRWELTQPQTPSAAIEQEKETLRTQLAQLWSQYSETAYEPESWAALTKLYQGALAAVDAAVSAEELPLLTVLAAAMAEVPVKAQTYTTLSEQERQAVIQRLQTTYETYLQQIEDKSSAFAEASRGVWLKRTAEGREQLDTARQTLVRQLTTALTALKDCHTTADAQTLEDAFAASAQQTAEGVDPTVADNRVPQGDKWDGTSRTRPAEGSGTAEDPYRITTAAELAWFADQVNGGQRTLCARLASDIDLNGYVWTPIGSTGGKSYQGTFDGGNSVVHGLRAESAAYAGLFGVIGMSGAVQRLCTAGTIAITAAQGNKISSVGAGGIAGYSMGIIFQCFSTVYVTNDRTSYSAVAGGIVGKASAQAVVDSCGSYGAVGGRRNINYIGGIAGVAQKGAVIRYCTNYGAVTGSRGVGGIVGLLTDYAQVRLCENQGAVDGESRVGGVVGWVCGADYISGNVLDVTIRNVGSYADVTADGSPALGYGAGGIVGYIDTADDTGLTGPCTLSCAYNTGTVTDNGGTTSQGVGGIVGEWHGGVLSHVQSASGNTLWGVVDMAVTASHDAARVSTVTPAYDITGGDRWDKVSAAVTLLAKLIRPEAGDEGYAAYGRDQSILYNGVILSYLERIESAADSGETETLLRECQEQLDAVLTGTDASGQQLLEDLRAYAGSRVYAAAEQAEADALLAAAETEIAGAATIADISNIRLKYLGDNGLLTRITTYQAKRQQDLYNTYVYNRNYTQDDMAAALAAYESWRAKLDSASSVEEVDAIYADARKALADLTAGFTEGDTAPDMDAAAAAALQKTRDEARQALDDLAQQRIAALTAQLDDISGFDETRRQLLTQALERGVTSIREAAAVELDSLTDYTAIQQARKEGLAAIEQAYTAAAGKLKKLLESSRVENGWDGITASRPHGSGTEADPYQIGTAQELAWLAYAVNNQTESGGFSAVLTADVDLGYCQWPVIGTRSSGSQRPYTGTFDGRGHTVSGLYITSLGGRQKLGLFGVAQDAVIRNLTVRGSIELTGVRSYDGDTAGYLIGGLLGSGEGIGVTISNCVSQVDVSVSFANDQKAQRAAVGGLVGRLSGSGSHTLTDCRSEGRVYTAFAPGACYLGGSGGDGGQAGIVGFISAGARLERCVNAGEVYAGRAAGVGGIVGSAGSSGTEVTLFQCANQGAVSNDTAAVLLNKGGTGGVLGLAAAGTVTVRSCYNTGSVAGSTIVGGILGGERGEYSANAQYGCRGLTLENCYNAGGLLVGTATVRVGALAGYPLDGRYYTGLTVRKGACRFVMGWKCSQGDSVKESAVLTADTLFEGLVDSIGGVNSGYPLFDWQLLEQQSREEVVSYLNDRYEREIKPIATVAQCQEIEKLLTSAAEAIRTAKTTAEMTAAYEKVLARMNADDLLTAAKEAAQKQLDKLYGSAKKNYKDIAEQLNKLYETQKAAIEACTRSVDTDTELDRFSAGVVDLLIAARVKSGVTMKELSATLPEVRQVYDALTAAQKRLVVNGRAITDAQVLVTAYEQNLDLLRQWESADKAKYTAVKSGIGRLAADIRSRLGDCADASGMTAALNGYAAGVARLLLDKLAFTEGTTTLGQLHKASEVLTQTSEAVKGLTREQLALLPAEQVAGVSRAQLLLAVYTRASEQLDTWLKNDKASYADVAQRLERLADSVRQELERSVDRDSAAKALDHYCGGSVEVLISSIGTVKPVMPPTEAAAAKTRLQRARTAYNALTASQKALVPNYASLQEGETAYRTYESNYAAAKAAESLISAIGTVTADSGDAIRKAQEAYDALTAEQKQLVDARLVQQMETAAAQYRQLLAQSAENGGETPSAGETMSDGVKPADRMQPTDQTRPEQAQPFDWSLVWLGGGILASAAAIALILRWLAAVRRTEKKNKA